MSAQQAGDVPQVDAQGFGLAALWAEAEQVRYLNRWGIVRQILLDSFKSFRLSPLTSLLSLASIAAALFLFGVFLLVFQNVYGVLLDSASSQTVSVYLQDTVTDSEHAALLEQLADYSEVTEVQVWGKEKALIEFERSFAEFPELLAGLEQDNPLPSSFELSIAEDLPYDEYRTLVERLRELDGVIHVGFEHELLEQLSGLIGFIRRTGAAAVFVILLITGFVIASTIRLALYLRQNELSIMRLVGADAWYIRAPCLLEGFLYGCIGGIVSLFLLYGFFSTLMGSMHEVAGLQSLVSSLSFLSFARCLLVLTVGIGVGVGASFFASRKAVNE